MVQMRVEGVGVDGAGRPVVLLQEVAGKRQFPIWIGPLEADAIAGELTGRRPPRPMTHDLLCAVLRETRCAVGGLRICNVREGVYYAQLHLRVGRKTTALDCRPSDGIAIALRVAAPIMVASALLEQASSRQRVEVWRAGERASLLMDRSDETVH